TRTDAAMISALHGLKGLAGLALLGLGGWSVPVAAQSIPCIECISVRVGPPVVVRGPFPDELDAPFTALKLSDGTIRAFTANGITFAVDGPSLWDLRGPRVPVLEPGPEGSINDCGRWLTTAL